MKKPVKTAWTAAAMMILSILCGTGTIAIAVAIASNTFQTQPGIETLPPIVAAALTLVMGALSFCAFRVANEYHCDYHEILDVIEYDRWVAGSGK